ncbi:MAG: fibronectin type III domain-containing protein [Acidimicrobiales bacterium]
MNAAGSSDWSNWSTSEHPLSEPAAPAAPIVTRGNRYLDVDWTAPNNNGDPVSTYELQIQSTNQIVSIAGASTTDYRWASLTNGQPQQFRVRASNRDPDPGAWSAWSTPVVPCSVPDAATAPTVVRGDGQVTVSWTAPADQGCAISSYSIRANGTLVQTTGATNSYVFTGLSNGTTTASTSRHGTRRALACGAAPRPPSPAGPPTAPTISSLTPTAIGQLTAAWGGAYSNGAPITRHEISVNGGAPLVGGCDRTHDHRPRRQLHLRRTGTGLQRRGLQPVPPCRPPRGPPSAPVAVNASCLRRCRPRLRNLGPHHATGAVGSTATDR